MLSGRVRVVIGSVINAVLMVSALLILVVYSLVVRRASLTRQGENSKPRIVYGPVPLISTKYMKEAVSRLGYEARTCVHQIYHINRREDFDYFYDDFFTTKLLRGNSRWQNRLKRYLIFMWLLSRFDVFNCNFSGGFLEGTPLRFLEAQLLHLAGKRMVVMPYGADVMDLVHCRSLVWRHTTISDYPTMISYQADVARQIRYFSKYADFIIGAGFCIDAMPRWDMLVTNYYPIDTELWKPGTYWSNADGKNGEVVVFHSPNHRWLKGTDFLILGCRELEKEGYRLRLVIAEKVSNAEVRVMMENSDILAEQFGMPGYGLNGMEGMSLAKPVLTDLSDRYYTEALYRYTGLDECPIVNTPPQMIKENLRMLIEKPELRHEIGEAGRRYVLKYHSYEAMGRMWEMIYRKVWNGENIDLAVWHPDRHMSDSCKKETLGRGGKA